MAARSCQTSCLCWRHTGHEEDSHYPYLILGTIYSISKSDRQRRLPFSASIKFPTDASTPWLTGSQKDKARDSTDGLLMYVNVAALFALRKDCLTMLINEH
jgi:hypothetical protein